MRTTITALVALAIATGATAQSTWWVSPTGNDANSGSQSSPFLTINHANAVATTGDIVRLTSGTFGNEQGIVILGSKNLTVIGDGMGATIVQANSALTTNIDTGYDYAPVPTQQRPVVLVEGGSRVDFRGITFDGNYAMPANGRLLGLVYRDGADGVVENSEVRNIRSNPIDSSQGAAGILVRGDNGTDQCQVTLRNCYVHDWGKVGVVSYFNANLTVEDTRVVGMGHLDSGVAQNGIQVSFLSSGQLRRATVTDIFYTPTTAAATGILAYDAATTFVVEDCSIANCEDGIYAFSLTNPLLFVSMKRNRVHATDFAVTLDNIFGAVVSDNSLHLSTDFVPGAAYDNVAGNSWNDNRYSSHNGAGTYTIPGGGGNIDYNAKTGLNQFTYVPLITPLAAGHLPKALVAAQLDGLGGTDFATADENGSLSLSVGLNVGGTFAVTNVPLVPAIASDSAVAIVAGQFDNLPGTDLAVLTTKASAPFSSRVYLLANNGLGAFLPLGNVVLTGFTQASGLAAGDVNGDGVADLVATDAGSNRATLLLNNGFGTLFTQTSLPGAYTNPCTGATIARLDGDAFADIAVVAGNTGTGRLHLLLGDGSGTFTPAAGSPLTIANDPTSVTSSDLDGDGDFDVLVASGTTTGGGVTVLENNGTLNFRRAFYLTDGQAATIAIGDLDNDGLPNTAFGDAAVVNRAAGTISVLGSYVAGAGFASGGIAEHFAPLIAVAFGNFDNDPWQDIIFCNGYGSVVYLPGRPTARVDHYGFGSPGYHGRVPYLTTGGNPAVATQPNPTLTLTLENGAPFSLAAFALSGTPSPVLLPGYPMVGTIAASWIRITDANGACSSALPIPPAPAYRGLELYLEAAVFDPAATQSFFPNVSLTRGLRLRIGW